MNHESEILITGGGLNGPALALALAQAGFDVTIIDALPVQTRKTAYFDGRGYALALASKRLLDAIGVWRHVAEHAQEMLEIKVSDGHAGLGASPFFMHFDHADIAQGPLGFMLEDRFLRCAFLDAMADNSKITQISGETVVAQKADRDGISVTLGSGKTLRGQLLVGSDGRNSGTARRANINRQGWDYGQTALVCAIDHAVPHHGIAHQFFMPSGPLAILPLPGNRSSIVWTETTANAATIHALSDADYLTALRPRFGDFLGEISLAGKRFTYPLALTLANRFVDDRLALVGDAAHGMHPIAGQGLNAGLRDIAALADVLGKAKNRGEDIAAPLTLARYQQWRRFDTHALAMVTDLSNKLFSNDNPILRLARNLGMETINTLPSLRKSFIREAAGLAGDLPELMQE